MQDFVEMHREALKKYFDFPSGVPSHDTYQRLWDNLCSNQFRECFGAFVESLQKITSDIMNIDEKTIRNSSSNKPLHRVSAWCYKNKMVFAQENVNEKSNEIKAIPKLLKLLDLENKIITINAMGAQRDMCQKIVERKGDYGISLKGNQGTLFEDVKLFLSELNNHEFINENNDKGHGRIEQRVAVVSHHTKWLNDIHQWPGLKSIGRITSTVLRKGKESKDTQYYISSKLLSAFELNEIARQHWEIENQLHWVLDVVFNEDKACIRNDCAAKNLDILRKWALTILHKSKDKPENSIKSIMRKNSMYFKHLIHCVNTILHG
ncbi:ISAs1 family transposase [Holospora obtusa]|nr:ISAs1 family transposase [Holospora obtusa]